MQSSDKNIMNTFKKSVAFLMLMLSAISCSGFLDQVPDDRLTQDVAFEQRGQVEDFLANIYSRLPHDTQRFVGGNNGPWTGASDEPEFVWRYDCQNDVHLCAWEATSGHVNDMWSNHYQGIRAASYFMENVEQCKQCDSGNVIRYKAEARALRAIFHYNLVRIFGPVITFGDTYLDPDASLEEVQIPRTPFDEVVEYVVNELDAAAVNLPESPPNGAYYGRMTRPFLMGIKSNLLLVAASPLFNGNPDYADLRNSEGVPLFSQQYDPSKWERAASAAKEFLDQYDQSMFQLYRKNGPDG